MNDKYDTLGNQLQDYIELTEEDFYPPSDDRVFKSYIDDIRDGDNFSDYCKYIFDIFDEKDYWD